MKTLGIIPARYASTRFPGKPLIDLAGKTMVQRVYENAVAAPDLAAVVVATDDARIYQAVQAFGGQVVMTGSLHATGTDRCAEVAQHFPEVDLVLNIQGDEPFLRHDQIAAVLQPLKAGTAEIATLAMPFNRLEDLQSSNTVKIVVNAHGQALYFSRSVIPHRRGVAPEDWLTESVFLRHIGLYGFRRRTLLEVAAMDPTPLEQIEMLEQLRWLYYGKSIAVGHTTHPIMGIDTPEDYAKALTWLQQHGTGS